MKPQNYFVYITTNPDRHTVLYIGVTNDLELRLNQHSLARGSEFARQHNATKLIYYESCSEPESAIAREKQLKNWAKKEALIGRVNPDWRNLIDEMFAVKGK